MLYMHGVALSRLGSKTYVFMLMLQFIEKAIKYQSENLLPIS